MPTVRVPTPRVTLPPAAPPPAREPTVWAMPFRFSVAPAVLARVTAETVPRAVVLPIVSVPAWMLVVPVNVALAPERVVIDVALFCVTDDTVAPRTPEMLSGEVPVATLVIVTAAPVPTAPPIGPVRAKTSLVLPIDASLMAMAAPVAPIAPEIVSVVVDEFCVAFFRR